MRPNSDPASLWAPWFTDRNDGSLQRRFLCLDLHRAAVAKVKWLPLPSFTWKMNFYNRDHFFLCIWPLSFSAMIRFRKQMQTVKLFSVRFCREPPGCGLIVCNWCNSLYNGKYLFHLQTGDLDNTTVGLFVNLFYHYHCQTVKCPPSYWRRKSQAQEWCANCFCLFFIMQDKHVWLNFFFLFFHFRLFE